MDKAFIQDARNQLQNTVGEEGPKEEELEYGNWRINR